MTVLVQLLSADVHREYILATVDGRQESRHRSSFQARWMAQPGRVGAVNWDAYQ